MTKNENNDALRGTLVEAAGRCFPLQVCKSHAGYYIGTYNDDGEPFTRESEEYWRKPDQAERALNGRLWTQRFCL